MNIDLNEDTYKLLLRLSGYKTKILVDVVDEENAHIEQVEIDNPITPEQAIKATIEGYLAKLVKDHNINKMRSE